MSKQVTNLEKITTDLPKFLELYCSNASTRDIAEYYGVSYGYVIQYIIPKYKAAGIITPKMDALRDNKRAGLERSNRLAQERRMQKKDEHDRILVKVRNSELIHKYRYYAILANEHKIGWNVVLDILKSIDSEYFSNRPEYFVRSFTKCIFTHNDYTHDGLYLLMVIHAFDVNTCKYLGRYNLTLSQQVALGKCIGQLPLNQKQIINLRYFNKNNYTLRQVGEILDLSRERVRQIEAKALAWLRKSSNLEHVYMGHTAYTQLIKERTADSVQIQKANYAEGMYSDYGRRQLEHHLLENPVELTEEEIQQLQLLLHMYDGNVTQIKICDIHFSTRARRVLDRLGCKVVGDIHCKNQLYLARHCGLKTCDEITKKLAVLGYIIE